MNEKQSTNNTFFPWSRGKCIGKGSFGTVNIAYDPHSDTVFAVKSVDFNASPSQLTSLHNEIHLLRSFSSPYIVKFFREDVTCESFNKYWNLHIEYMPNGHLASGRRVTEEDRVRFYAFCLVSALKYLHERGVVHCDVKGSNVLVGDDVVKLADFGSAMVVNGGDTVLFPRGSPLWMAPEVVRGEYQGPESDVWSLGCTVIEMMTGEPPWHDNGGETLKSIGFSDELPEFPSGLSEIGRDFLYKCLNRDFKQRWSCDQLLQHPFLSCVPPIKLEDTSPRCVLDWSTSDFDHCNDDDVEGILPRMIEGNEDSAKQRRSELATSRGANWEFDDNWVVVRGTENDEEGDGVELREGTSSVYFGDEWIREEINEERTKWECESCGSSGCAGGADPSCGFGSPNLVLAVEVRELVVVLYFCYKYCRFILRLLNSLILFVRYIRNFFNFIIRKLNEPNNKGLN